MALIFKDEHTQNLPSIRISELVIENFKNIKHGKIVFNNGEKKRSDILGIYGQNGSGKTAVIDALFILKAMLTGTPIPPFLTNRINTKAEYAFLKFSFDVIYPEGDSYPSNGDIRKIEYSFKLKRAGSNAQGSNATANYAINYNYDGLTLETHYTLDLASDILPYDEVIKVGGTICGKKCPLKPIVDTTKNSKNVIEPATKLRELIGIIDDDKIIELRVNKNIAMSKNISFIFMKETQALFLKNSGYSMTFQILAEFRIWGALYLYVWSSYYFPTANQSDFPLFVDQGGYYQVHYIGPSAYSLDKAEYDSLKETIIILNRILPNLIPDLSLKVKEISKLIENGVEKYKVDLLSDHNDHCIPFYDESEGIKRIVSILAVLKRAFTDDRTTLAIDEMDQGVFEELLGVLLSIFQEKGKGQLIFTSHNLRPLEVLNKEFICFTTIDENNRYKKLSNIAKTNNMRKVYYREISEKHNPFYAQIQEDQLIDALNYMTEE